MADTVTDEWPSDYIYNPVLFYLQNGHHKQDADRDQFAGMVPAWQNESSAATLEAIRRIRLCSMSGFPILSLAGLNALEHIPQEAESLEHLVGLQFNHPDEDGQAEWSLKSLSPLSGMKNLRMVELPRTRHGPMDMSALGNLTQIEHLSGGVWQDFSVLAKLKKLRRFYAHDCSHVTDLSPLEDTGINVLQLADVAAQDLSPITRLTQLEELDLVRPRSTDLDIIGTCTLLEKLVLHGIKADEWRFLERLENLKKLSLLSCSIDNFSFVNRLYNLTFLGFRGSGRVDVAALTSLAQLKELALPYQSEMDLSPLLSLQKLSTLALFEPDHDDGQEGDVWFLRAGLLRTLRDKWTIADGPRPARDWVCFMAANPHLNV